MLLDQQTFAKVVICGSSTVGKTTIFNQIVNHRFDMETTSTTGASFASVTYQLNDEEVHINFWDTAGQEEYRSLVNIYFRETDAVLIVFDLTKHKTFEDVDSWMDEVYANCGIPLPQVIVIGNKSDLEENREVTQNQIDEFILKTSIPYFEISAKSGSNVELLMKNIGLTSSQCIKAKLARKAEFVNLNQQSPVKENKDEESDQKCC